MIPVTILEFVLHSERVIDLGANPGASLRGGLYETLAVMYDTGDPVRSRHDLDSNTVAWLMRMEDVERTGGKDVPRPLALRPSARWNEGEEQCFSMALYGRGIETASLLISAVAAMGQIGVGRARRSVRYRLGEVRAVDPLSRQTTVIVDAQGKQVEPLPEPPSEETYRRFARLLDAERVALTFLTPTRITHHGKQMRRPEFRPLFQRLIERIRQLSTLYAADVWVPFDTLIAAADRIQLAEDHTRWQELWSHSRSDGVSKPMSGYIGEARYAGDLELLLPYLLIGQALQVGKNTIKGAGWYEISYRWR